MRLRQMYPGVVSDVRDVHSVAPARAPPRPSVVLVRPRRRDARDVRASSLLLRAVADAHKSLLNVSAFPRSTLRTPTATAHFVVFLRIPSE